VITTLLNAYAQHYPSNAPNPINQLCGPNGTTPLMMAAEHGFDEGVTLFEQGFIRKHENGEGERLCADEKVRDRTGNTLLHYLARGPHTLLTERLLNCFPTMLNLDNQSGHTPVRIAVDYNQLDQLRMLVSKGAVLGADRDCNNLLHAACLKSNATIIVWLLKNRFSPNDANQTTRLFPIDIAIAHTNLAAIIPLLEHGAGLFNNFPITIREMLTRAQNRLVVNNRCLLIGATIDRQPLQPDDFNGGVRDLNELRSFLPIDAVAHSHLLARIHLFPAEFASNRELLAVKECLANDNLSSSMGEAIVPRREEIATSQLQLVDDISSEEPIDTELNFVALQIKDRIQHQFLSQFLKELQDYHALLNECYTDEAIIHRGGSFPCVALKIVLLTLYLFVIIVDIVELGVASIESVLFTYFPYKNRIEPDVSMPTNITHALPDYFTLVKCKYNNTLYKNTLHQQPYDCQPSIPGILQLLIVLSTTLIVIALYRMRDPRYSNSRGLQELPTYLKDREDSFVAYIEAELQKIRDIPAAEHTDTDQRFLEVATAFLEPTIVATRKAQLTNLEVFIERTELPRLNHQQQERRTRHHYDNFTLFREHRALAQQASGDAVDNAERGIRAPLLLNAGPRRDYATLAALRR
jgi:hypothetical protein